MKTRGFRKPAALLTSAVICIGTISIGAYASAKGDINNDGQANKNDAQTMVDFLLANSNSISGNADFNSDGKVNAADATLLRRMLLEDKET